ncbi:MAG: CPBP family glutamic-type intramembrane protease [Balneolaceae bacterium]
MKLKVLFMIGLFITQHSFAQEKYPEVSNANSSVEFARIVQNAQDSVYNSIIGAYDSYLIKNNNDYRTYIEKCSFIELAFFDDDEYYNPKYEEYAECLKDLKTSFPTEPYALIYYYDNSYSDSSISGLENLMESITNDYIETPENIWLAYSRLASHYSYEEGNIGTAIAYAKDAMSANDTLDLSLLIAKQYVELDDNDQALFILQQNFDSIKTSASFYLKGELFFQLKDYESAYKAYQLSLSNEEGWDLSSEMGAVLISLDRFEEARSYLIEASDTEWGQRKALEELFKYDLKYSDPDTAVSSYQKMRDIGFMADPFGIYRVQLLFQKRVLWVSFRDFLPIFSFIVLILLVILIPYLWVLPIYSYGKWKNKEFESTPINERWELKHFWYFCSLFLFASIFAELIINYSDMLVALNDEYSQDVISSSLQLAHYFLLFDFLVVIGTVALLRFKDIKSVIGDKGTWQSQVLSGVGYYFVLRIGYGFLETIFGGNPVPGSGILFSLLDDSISATIENYGVFLPFLLVVITGPILEEIQFRGIILGASAKYVPFWAANVIQSLLFVFVHDDLSLFLFYFSFGMLTGYLRKSTGGYIAPMVLHILNNGIFFIYFVFAN